MRSPPRPQRSRSPLQEVTIPYVQKTVRVYEKGHDPYKTTHARWGCAFIGSPPPAVGSKSKKKRKRRKKGEKKRKFSWYSMEPAAWFPVVGVDFRAVFMEISRFEEGVC